MPDTVMAGLPSSGVGRLPSFHAVVALLLCLCCAGIDLGCPVASSQGILDMLDVIIVDKLP
jgi:hypothetical protein